MQDHTLFLADSTSLLFAFAALQTSLAALFRSLSSKRSTMSKAPASPFRPPHSPKLAPLSPAIAFCPSSSLTTQNSVRIFPTSLINSVFHSQPTQSGASLDDFQIIRCLGRGSSSRVFLVRLLRPELLTNPLSPPAHLSSLNLSNTELPPVFALKVISKNDVVMRNRVRSSFPHCFPLFFPPFCTLLE